MNRALRARQWGAPGAPPVVLLHGFLGRADDWNHVAEILAVRRRIVAPDLPGHGASIDLAGRAYSLDGAADAVLSTLDALGVERVSVAGYSLGGRVAAYVALRAPDRTRALVLASAHPGIASRAERARRLALDRERAGRLVEDPQGFLEAWYRMPMFGLEDDPSRRLALVEDRLRGEPGELARALAGLSTGRQRPLGERLRALGVPTLLVAGGRDPAYVGLLSGLAAASGFALHVEPSASHAVHLDRPAAFASVVDAFLERNHPAEHVHD